MTAAGCSGRMLVMGRNQPRRRVCTCHWWQAVRVPEPTR